MQSMKSIKAGLSIGGTWLAQHTCPLLWCPLFLPPLPPALCSFAPTFFINLPPPPPRPQQLFSSLPIFLPPSPATTLCCLGRKPRRAELNRTLGNPGEVVTCLPLLHSGCSWQHFPKEKGVRLEADVPLDQGGSRADGGPLANTC